MEVKEWLESQGLFQFLQGTVQTGISYVEFLKKVEFQFLQGTVQTVG